MPRLKEPSWHRDAHSALYHELGQRRVDELELSPAERKAKRRNERKLARAAGRLINGVTGAAPRTRVRHRATSTR